MKKFLSFVVDASFVLILISFLALQSFMVQNSNDEIAKKSETKTAEVIEYRK